MNLCMALDQSVNPPESQCLQPSVQFNLPTTKNEENSSCYSCIIEVFDLYSTVSFYYNLSLDGLRSLGV